MSQHSRAQELWMPVVGYEGHYEVSNEGRVRSLDRFSLDMKRLHGRQLRPWCNSRAYWRVCLSIGGKQRTIDVHVLVASAFLGPRREGMEVRHLNGNSLDNNASNLQWGTTSENIRDQVEHGTHPHARKVTCPRGHQLQKPNLVASQARRGYRSCLACARAKNTSHRLAQPFDSNEADSRYERIMAA